MIIIPDSFKGSISSTDAADIIAKEAKNCWDGEIVQIPIADGGEGSVDCILASLGGRKEYVTVQSPEGKDIQAFYGIIENGSETGIHCNTSDTTTHNINFDTKQPPAPKTAIIEIAESSGLTKQTSFHTGTATTYGFGQLISAALDRGCKTIYLCLGGSATTDCGCGMAAALGIRFLNAMGEAFIPVGDTMVDVSSIDFSGRDSRIADTNFIVMSDVSNPLYGESGAAYVYGPQKGATPSEVRALDEGLRNIATVMQATTGVDDFNQKNAGAATGVNNSNQKGAGAAGGCGFGCSVFLGATMKSGIETMLEISDFDHKLQNCSLIVTGEGKLDRQSLMGKVLHGIVRHAGNIPIVSFCGICELDSSELSSQNITAVEIGRGIPLDESMTNGAKYLEQNARKFLPNLIRT